MEPIINRPLPIGVVFRPTKFEMANIFLKKKVLGQSIEAPRVPGDCHDIFSRRLRDLPGYPREEHWYYFCRRRRNQVTSSNLWTPIGEETNVLDPKNRRLVVATRRRFTLLEKQEGEEYDWFLDEIRLPPTVSHSDWVLCHILGKKIEPEIEYFPPLIESEYDESESEDEESVDT